MAAKPVVVIGAGIALVILVLSSGQAGAADLLIRNARLIDGTGAPPRTGVAILVRDSRIAAIAPELAAPDSPLLDAGGATVLPGLIDAHVHLGVAPGSGQRHDPPEVERALRRWHLRAYLACGVTTVLDTSIAAATAREIQGWLRAGERGPRYLTLGPGLTTPGGYTPDVGEPVATPQDVVTRFDLLRTIGAVGVKVFVERGFGLRPVWPIHAPEMRAAIVRAAVERGLPIYVHAQREDDKTVALDMGAHAIVHGGFYDAAPSKDFIRRMAVAQACADGGHRCLVVGHPLGVEFPANTLAVRYAPYDEVFPRAAAVVVHGGAGTTGEALRCGRPVIGVPLAFDQFTLCWWIEKLGVGVRVPVAGRTQSDLARVLQRVLSDDSMRRLATKVGMRFAEERDGAESGADAIERGFGDRSTMPPRLQPGHSELGGTT